MRFRKNFFAVLAFLSLLWMCYGVFGSSAALSNFVDRATPIPAGGLSSEERAAAQNAGATIGAGLGLTFFACTGLPLFAFFSLLSWRNSVGIRKEAMHREQIEALKGAKGSSA
jgi:hypothetical protein